MTDRLGKLSLAAASAGLLLAAATAPVLAEDDDPWPDLREALFGDRAIHDGAGVIALEAPVRAYDAAIVPITMVAEIPQSGERYIQSITLIVDKNPAPVAAVFRTSPLAGDATIATRIRVNEYTNVRAIAETSDGELYMAARYVKAAGGCSAPALKDQEQALARLGKMKLKQTAAPADGAPGEIQLLISHPNYSGLQMDPVTRHYIPAEFVQAVTVTYAGETLLSVEGAISLSEDPSFRFHYRPQGAGEISVQVRDSDAREFSERWPLPAEPSS